MGGGGQGGRCGGEGESVGQALQLCSALCTRRQARTQRRHPPHHICLPPPHPPGSQGRGASPCARGARRAAGTQPRGLRAWGRARGRGQVTAGPNGEAAQVPTECWRPRGAPRLQALPTRRRGRPHRAPSNCPCAAQSPLSSVLCPHAPGPGRKFWNGSSALMRHSMAWPLYLMSSWLRVVGVGGGGGGGWEGEGARWEGRARAERQQVKRKGRRATHSHTRHGHAVATAPPAAPSRAATHVKRRGLPMATRICSWMRSTPVIISVTGCST